LVAYSLSLSGQGEARTDGAKLDSTTSAALDGAARSRHLRRPEATDKSSKKRYADVPYWHLYVS
jgi:hypothetical protein